MRLAIATLLGLLVSSPSARSFDYMTSRGIGMGHTLTFSEPSSATLLNLPSSVLKPSAWQVEGGYNRRFELSDLDQVYLAGSYRHRMFSFALGASQYGKSDLYAEQILKGSVAFHYRHFSFGPTLSAMQVQIGNGYGSLRAAAVGMGGSAAWSRLTVGLVADNLNRPKLLDNGGEIEPIYALYAELVGRGSFTVNGRATWEDMQKPQFGLGQTVHLSDRSMFFWGIGFNPLEYGGGIELKVASGAISYATSVHPTLGFSHTISFSYGGPNKKKQPKEETDDF